MYEITLSPRARRSLRRMQPEWSNRIVSKLEAVAKDPYGRHNNVTNMQGVEGYRLRIGDYRALYTLEDQKLVLHVVDIAPRGRVYN